VSSQRDFEALEGDALCEAGFHLAEEAGRYHSVLETNWFHARQRSEIGTGPVKSIELADDDPGRRIVQPEASLCVARDGDCVTGSARRRVCDWGNEYERVRVCVDDGEHNDAWTILGRFFEALAVLVAPQVGEVEYETWNRLGGRHG
jgi:hypothetical protein